MDQRASLPDGDDSSVGCPRYVGFDIIHRPNPEIIDTGGFRILSTNTHPLLFRRQF